MQTGPFGSQLHAADYSEEGIPVVMPQDMADGRIVCDRIARVSETHVHKLKRHVLRAGDLVFSRRGDVTRFAVVTENEVGWLCGTGSIRIRMNCPDVLVSYARRYLQQAEVGAWLLNEAKGVTMPNLNTQIIRALPFVFPPLPEQRRIAAILDQAETLRTQRRAALAQLDILAQSIFLDMFGDPVSNPKRWSVASLTEVCHCYSGGTPSKANAGFWEGPLPWFSAKDMKADDLFDSEDHIAEAVPRTSTLKLLPANTVAIVVRGMILAHTFPVCVLRIPATINQDLKALLPIRQIEPQFLASCLRSQSKYVLDKVSEAGHGTKRLDAQGLQKVRVLLPPEKLQQTFASRIQAIEALKATHRAALAELDALFASLQHSAFRGEL
ncbi:MAG: restriction endonuclease subunit S [Burkholderiaceae bacterium]